MRVDDSLMPDDERALRELTEGLSLLGDGPAVTPNAALQMFLAEQQVARLPRPREAAEALRPAVLPAPVRTMPSRSGRHRLAGRVASAGLLVKVLLGSSVALAGVTGAGVAGALPTVLQDVWDGVVDGAAAGRVPGEGAPSVPDDSTVPPAAPSAPDTAPADVPPPATTAEDPVPVQQSETVVRGGDLSGPATDPATAGLTEPAQDAPTLTPPSSDEAATPAGPTQPATAYDEGPATGTGTAPADTVFDSPTSEPAVSTAPAYEQPTTTTQPTATQPTATQPTATQPTSAPSGTASTGSGAGTSSAPSGTTTAPATGSSGW